jgi:hypothetical protein
MAFLEYRPTSTLFHYCSALGFDGITESGSIWLTDLQHANDPKELQLAKIIEQVMSELLEKATDAPEWQAVYHQLRYRLERLRQRFGMYSFSLSLNGDRLPMWQEYTDRGRGYCIGFRASAFNHMPLRVQKVTYAAPTYLGSLHPEVERIAQPLVGHETDFIREVEPVTDLLSLITSVKDDTWEHEAEVRLIFSSMARPEDFDGGPLIPVGLLGDGTPIYPADPQLRKRDGLSVPYFSKPFGRVQQGKWDPSRSITRVTIGPNNSRSPSEVEAYLRKTGYRDFEVVKSRCAFRP